MVQACTRLPVFKREPTAGKEDPVVSVTDEDGSGVRLQLIGDPEYVEQLIQLFTEGIPKLVGAVQSQYQNAVMALDGSWDVTGDGRIINDDIREGFELSRDDCAAALAACRLDPEEPEEE